MTENVVATPLPVHKLLPKEAIFVHNGLIRGVHNSKLSCLAYKIWFILISQGHTHLEIKAAELCTCVGIQVSSRNSTRIKKALRELMSTKVTFYTEGNEKVGEIPKGVHMTAQLLKEFSWERKKIEIELNPKLVPYTSLEGAITSQFFGS